MYSTASHNFQARPYTYSSVGFDPIYCSNNQAYFYYGQPEQASFPIYSVVEPTVKQSVELCDNFQPYRDNYQPCCASTCCREKIKTPTFSGDRDDEKWHNFISLFEKVCEINEFDTETKRLRLLTSLRDEALEFVDNLLIKITKDYCLLKSALADRFHIRYDENAFRSQFKNTVKLDNETLEDFLQDF